MRRRSRYISRFLRGRRLGDSQLVSYLGVPVSRRPRAVGSRPYLVRVGGDAGVSRVGWFVDAARSWNCGAISGFPDGAVRGLADLCAYFVRLGEDAGASSAFRYVVSAGCASYRAISGFLYFAGCRAMGLRAYLIQHDADRLL